MDSIAGLEPETLKDMVQSLRGEAKHLEGELVLGHLCEHCIELLELHNRPTGTCAFCLESLEDCQDVVVKLCCYHCFHRTCFRNWYGWKQGQLRKRRDEILREYKTQQMAVDALEREGIHANTQNMPRSDVTAFNVYCPCCRAICTPETVWMHVKDDKNCSSDIMSSWNENSNSTYEGEHSISMLPEPMLRKVRNDQQKYRALFQIQTQKNGIIDTRRNVISYP